MLLFGGCHECGGGSMFVVVATENGGQRVVWECTSCHEVQIVIHVNWLMKLLWPGTGGEDARQ